MRHFLMKQHMKIQAYPTYSTTTFLSVLGSLFIGLGKATLGIYYHSSWFLIVAGYYILLGTVRGFLLIKIVQSKNGIDAYTTLKVYHRSGFLLILLGISFFIWCIWLLKHNTVSVYPNYILFGVVAIAFYKIGSAIYGLLRARHHKSLLYYAIKNICFLDACVSMVNIQCMLLTMQKSTQAISSSARLGVIVSCFFLVIGVSMCWRKKGGDYQSHPLSV